MIQVRQAAGAIGAFVEGLDIGAGVDASARAGLVQALAEHGVLFLRNQPVDPVALRDFCLGFGTPQHHPAYPTVPEAPEVGILESTAAAPSKIEVWHADMTFRADPPVATALLADVVPEVGGDTLWASTYSAWETLSDQLRTLLAPLQAEHDFRHGFRESLAEPGGPERLAGAIAAHPPVLHPVALRHPVSGRTALNVNRLFTTRLAALPPAESAAVLEFLYSHITREEFTVRLGWQRGTLAIWDNRCTQHKPVNDYFPAHRRMLRVVVH